MEISCGIYLYSILNKKFLICHATRSKKSLWSIPKGLKETNESVLDAALRELFEETNIDADKINVLRLHKLPAVKYKKRNKILEAFLIITDHDFQDIKLKCHSKVSNQLPEIDQYKWIDFYSLKGFVHETQIQNLDEIKKVIETLQIIL